MVAGRGPSRGRSSTRPRTERPTSDFLKPQVLRDGSLIALGYRFHRDDPEQPIAIAATDGALPGDDVVSFSTDEGRTWTPPAVIPRSTPELLEIPSRPVAAAIRATSWRPPACSRCPTARTRAASSGRCCAAPTAAGRGTTGRATSTARITRSPPTSPTSCEMQPGRVVAICWAFDLAAGRYLHNQVTVSHDDGHTWSAAIDTGIQAESSNLLFLGGERLLSIHCHRGSEVGLYVRLVDFSGDRWQVLEETADLGRVDRAADARRPVVLRVRGFDPLRTGVAAAAA